MNRRDFIQKATVVGLAGSIVKTTANESYPSKTLPDIQNHKDNEEIWLPGSFKIKCNGVDLYLHLVD